MRRLLVRLAAIVAGFAFAGPANAQLIRPPKARPAVRPMPPPVFPPPAPTTAPVEDVKPVPPVPAAQIIRVLTMAQAESAFAMMAAHRDIAFTYPIDGCYSRAHLMVIRLQRLGYQPSKVWAFGHGEQLHARTAHDPRGFINWSWHVAPTLPVRGEDGQVFDMVIDPSLFSRPVSIPKWRDSMRKAPTIKEPYICQTRLGEPPLQPSGTRTAGTGYWTSADPPGNLDTHAVGVMRRYQSIADAR
jgi:hypothetical protein